MKLKLTDQHILYAIALANAVRLAWAYANADAGGNVFSIPGAFGSLLGVSISLGTAVIAGKLGGRLPKSRSRLTWASLVLLLLLEPVILAPITMSHMSAGLSETLGGFAWAWSVALALVPSLVLAGVSVSSGKLVAEAGTEPVKSESKPAESEPKPAKTAPEPVYLCECGREFGSQPALNAHRPHCKRKAPQAIPVEPDAVFAHKGQP